MNNITLLIHGPLQENCLYDIYKNYKKVKNIITNVVIVSYVHDYEEYTKILQNMTEWEPNIVQVKDVLNPGFFNINRQIVTVNAGLKTISPDNFIIKLRNDQFVDFKKLFKILNRNNLITYDSDKIISTNCYTRRDRLYHPSDMFLCGSYKAIKEYFSVSLMQETHIEHMINLQEEYKKNPTKYSSLSVVPESYLFRNYLKIKKWPVKETFEDSLNALKKFIFLINSWDIQLRWQKARTPYCPPKSIILPCTFKVAPFEDIAKENASCFNAHNINNQLPTITDLFFISKSRILFFIKYSSLKKGKYLIKYGLVNIACFILSVFPKNFCIKLKNKVKNKRDDYKNRIPKM